MSTSGFGSRPPRHPATDLHRRTSHGVRFQTNQLVLAAVILCLCLLPACGGSDGSSSGLLLPGEGGGNGIPGTNPGTGNATVQFGSTRFDGATGTAVDSLGNVYIAGNTWGTIDPTHPNPDPTASTADIFIAKYNAAGILQWIRQMGTPLNDYATGIAVDNTGNVIVVGYTFGDLFGANQDPQKLSTDFFILKLDPDGNQIWSLQDGTPEPDELWSVTTDKNNDIYVGGGTQGDFFPSSIRGILTHSSFVIQAQAICCGEGGFRVSAAWSDRPAQSS